MATYKKHINKLFAASLLLMAGLFLDQTSFAQGSMHEQVTALPNPGPSAWVSSISLPNNSTVGKSVAFDSKRFADGVDFAKRAKNQKTIAWVLAGTGAAMVITGLIIGNKDSETVDGAINDTFNGSILIVTGAVVGAASIPFFIMSGNNKRKAGVSGIFRLQHNQVLAGTSRASTATQPTLGLQMHF